MLNPKKLSPEPEGAQQNEHPGETDRKGE